MKVLNEAREPRRKVDEAREPERRSGTRPVCLDDDGLIFYCFNYSADDLNSKCRREIRNYPPLMINQIVEPKIHLVLYARN